MHTTLLKRAAGALVLAAAAGWAAHANADANATSSAHAQPPGASPPALIVYTARDTMVDAALLAAFGAQRGVRVERIVVTRDAMPKALDEASAERRADVLLSNDAAALAPLLQAGRLAALPASVRVVPGWHDPARRWVALTLRGRGLHTRIDSGLAAADTGWDSLADTRWRGRVCMRTSANAYQRSMLALLIVQRGEDAARRWARDVVANFARPPAAGDYAQLTDLAEGRCALGVANHSYALWLRHDDSERKAIAPQVASAPMATAMPNPGWGAVVTGSRQPALAAALLDFLLDAQVNATYAAASHEYPVVADAPLLSNQVRTLGPWRPIPPDWAALLAALPRADALLAEVGWR